MSLVTCPWRKSFASAAGQRELAALGAVDEAAALDQRPVGVLLDARDGHHRPHRRTARSGAGGAPPRAGAPRRPPPARSRTRARARTTADSSSPPRRSSSAEQPVDPSPRAGASGSSGSGRGGGAAMRVDCPAHHGARRDLRRHPRLAAVRLDGPRARPARARRRATSTRRCCSCRSTRSPTRTTTGTGGSSSRTSSATPPPRRPSTARSGWSTRPASRGELVLREVRTGRVETSYMWGRGESVREEFRRIRAQ